MNDHLNTREAAVSVRAALQAAGLPATDEELRLLAAGYPRLRAGVASLYRLGAANATVPSTSSTPVQPPGAWPAEDPPTADG